jgi:N-dimethylarginine dimethylaminohydrolase
MDIPAFERRVQEEERRKGGFFAMDEEVPEPTAAAQQWRALRHALAEFDIPVHRVGPTQPLSEALAS